MFRIESPIEAAGFLEALADRFEGKIPDVPEALRKCSGMFLDYAVQENVSRRRRDRRLALVRRLFLPFPKEVR